MWQVLIAESPFFTNEWKYFAGNDFKEDVWNKEIVFGF